MTLAKRLALIMAAVAAATTLALAIATDVLVRHTLKSEGMARQETHARMLADQVSQLFAQVQTDLTVLRDGSEVLALAQAAAQGHALEPWVRANAEKLLVARAAASPLYLQLRVLGPPPLGRELLRVERAAASGPVRLTAPSALQDKGHRPYYRQALRQSTSGGPYVSPIELNREHGKIQEPHAPVLRMAYPLAGADGHKVGVLVANVAMQTVFSQLKSTCTDCQVYVLDLQGRYLEHPDPARAFGFELGPAETFQADFPQAAALVSQASKARAMLYPGAEGEPEVITSSPIHVKGEPRMILVIKRAGLGGVVVDRTRWMALLVGLLALGLSVIAAYAAVRSVTRPLATMTAAARELPAPPSLPLPTRAAGEVGVLARALQTMQRELAGREAELLRGEERFRQMFELSPAAKIAFDADQCITVMNRTAERLFGYSRNELLGEPIHTLLPDGCGATKPRDRPPDAFKSGIHAAGTEPAVRGRRRDGSELSLLVAPVPIESPDGPRTIAVLVDVTDQRKTETMLRNSNTQLEQFAYVASHDLQEPLRMVSAYVELLARRYRGQLDEKADGYIGHMVGGVKRMQALIRDLLEYSRVGAQDVSMEPVDMAAVVQMAKARLSMASPEARDAIEVSALPTVLGVKGRLGQVMQNLLGNALKFRSERPPQVRVDATFDGQHWRFSVADNGIGIEPEHRERVFDMFQRLHTREEYAGTGIGLAIAKRIIERHGGTIWCESTPGVGTTFFFTLSPAQTQTGGPDAAVRTG